MKNRIVLFFAFSLFFLGFGAINSVQAQGCKSATAVVTDIYNNYGKVLKKFGCSLTKQNSCLDNVNKYEKIVKEQIAYWNKRSKTTAWATIGPRSMKFGDNYKGTLIGTGGRMFISVAPSNKSSLTVSIDELDGKGKTSVVICKVDKNGTYWPLATKWFNDTKARKKDKREKRKFTIKGVKGHLISVHFDGKSVANKFQYKLNIR